MRVSPVIGTGKVYRNKNCSSLGIIKLLITLCNQQKWTNSLQNPLFVEFVTVHSLGAVVERMLQIEKH